LKKGVKSAYGNELTSKDVVWKYQRNFALKAVGRFMCAVNDLPNPEAVRQIMTTQSSLIQLVLMLSKRLFVQTYIILFGFN